MRTGPLPYLSLIFLSILSYPAAALNWTATPFTPHAVPLAVRSPYLSAWLAQGAGAALNDAWATFWTGSIVGWAGYVRVDGTPYTFMGIPAGTSPVPAKAIQKSLNWTATQSTFVLSAGGVDLTATFLSPITPTKLVNQSFPFSYLALSAAPNDGKPHTVQVYTDITGEWLTSNASLVANWSTSAGASAGVWTHEVQLAQQEVYGEVKDRVQYGSAYYSTLATPNTTYQTGEDTLVRSYFLANGTLPGTQDTAFRAVSDRWPVFAFAHDLGTVDEGGVGPVMFAVGHVRDPAVEYVVGGAGGSQNRSLYFWSQYDSVDDAIADFIADYPNALTTAEAFDARLQADASKVSSNYADIVALSVRQAMATVELTISKGSDGSWNTSDSMMFLKEISSSGLASTTDVIFASWPLWLYANPALGKYLLRPLLAYQASGMYPNQWSAHDLGTYPKALGHNDGKDLAMPVEECGNMLIMALSYTLATSDHSLITTYYTLLDQWTQYLVTNSLMPANQLSTDAFAGSLANQTNLAIKGIVGIKAMSVIANMTGDAGRAADYSSVASGYAEQFSKLAMASTGGHLTLNYGDDRSWGLAYNLYADVLLGTQVFPKLLYQMQDCWYGTVASTYGVPLDTRHTYTESDWEIWMAALATSTQTRDLFIESVHNYATYNVGNNSEPLGDWYDAISGVAQAFRARPQVGAHLALLLINATTTNAGSQGCALTSTSSFPAFSGTQGPSATGGSSGAAPSHTSPATRVIVRPVLLVSLAISVLGLSSGVWDLIW
ncbi:DUF1793-domain-containing protein [Gloeophyllum trabeum ATCC 11539]|uniref:DUF1793-domain-containing protein n=1 Tax=Gloeophyllum trabeum (strain ATCC 11539 / FP-39264 / Madison 617) TaxID=670483 RepID=S7Q7J9_GLOTA|nr:DUF1793-domain-containing protein [Gloeophyllum trabeum ATCC 11539]EPQ55448.1 DUF1793-domain-containing protein [Gloeophyllum trabeum ATCC 11539]